MHSDGFFFQAFVYLAAAVIAVPIAKRFGLGAVLGYLLAGAAIGPFGLGLVGAGGGGDVMHVAEFGVVMMLFVVGLELEPELLWRMRGPILGTGGLQVGVTTLLGTVVAHLLGLAWAPALAIGMTFALSSTAIVLQVLNEKGLLKTAAGQQAFAVLLFQDIAVIPMLALLPLLAPSAPVAAGEHHTLVDGLPGWGKALAVLVAVGFIALLGRFALQPIFRAIAGTRLRELFTAATLLLVVGIALLMTQVGLSPALGTFLAGVLLATSEYRHELESDIEPFKGLLLGLFFIAVGASIDFALIAADPGRIVGLVALVLVSKAAILAGLARLARLSMDQGALFTVALPQVGEFAFVLLAFAGSLGLLGREITDPLVAVVALSMAVTPLLFLGWERVLAPRFGTKATTDREADAVHGDAPVIIAGFDEFGTVVGRLLRANGVEPTVLDNDSDRVDVLRRLGLPVFYGDPTRHDLLRAAGAERAKVIVLALDAPAQVIELVHTVRKHFPHLIIFARAHDRGDAHELLDLGLAHVYRETLDTSLQVGVDVLTTLGHRAYSTGRAARTFRRHDEAALRELAAMRSDRALFLTTAKQRIAELEHLLQADRAEPDLERDAAWDPTSLREEHLNRP